MKVNILSPLKPVVSGVYEAVDNGFRFFEECDRSRTAVDSRRKSIASKHFELWDSLIKESVQSSSCQSKVPQSGCPSPLMLQSPTFRLPSKRKSPYITVYAAPLKQHAGSQREYHPPI